MSSPWELSLGLNAACEDKGKGLVRHQSKRLPGELYQEPEVKELLARKVVERGLIDRLSV